MCEVYISANKLRIMNETECGSLNFNVDCTFYFYDSVTNRKKLFEEALKYAKLGKVLYILQNEIEELPKLSQDLTSVNKHFLKMISFLYAKNLDTLLESVPTLDSWQNVPSTIILDDLSRYCEKDEIQNACGVVAMFIDIARSCSVTLKTQCRLFISVSKERVCREYHVLKDLYSN